MNDKKSQTMTYAIFCDIVLNNNNHHHHHHDDDDDDVTYVAQIRTSRKFAITCQSRTEMFSVKIRRLSETYMNKKLIRR